MEILERYLLAVGEHLPARGRADTLAELRANLEAEIEGREDAAGRPLTEAEVAQVLEAHGMPVLVAARYGPQHFLIGPQLFPFYWYTLKRSFPLVLVAYAAVQVISAIVQSGSGENLGQRIGAAAGHFPAVALTFWAVMTLGFAVFEYAQGRYVPKLTPPKWSVRDLPALEPEEKKHSLTSAVAELIVSVLIVIWLLAVPNHPFLIIGPGAKVVNGMPFGLTPEWHIFYWQIVGLLIAMLPLKIAMIVPSLRRVRGWLQLAINAMGILILVIMVQVRTFFVAGTQISAENLKSLAGINAGITLGFKVVLAISVIKFLWDLWKEITGGQQRREALRCGAVR
jgi:hypothetical protein